jgi:hypothetical protein
VSGDPAHARGQTLHVTSGSGVVQARDGQAILMRPSDSVYTRPGVWRWHGALPQQFMTHLALAEQGSSAVGGTVVTRPGTFDAQNPMDPGGQTLHGDQGRLSLLTAVLRAAAGLR